MLHNKNEEQTNVEENIDENFSEELDADVEATAQALSDATENEASSDNCDKVVTIPLAEYQKLQADLEEAKDRGLRALAELENFRARTNRLAQEERKYASLDLARDILPVWDNLGLALAIEEPEKNVSAVVDGVKMVYQEFLNILDKNGIKKIDALHQPFDPKFHESVAFVPNGDFPANTVVVELKAGFTLHERVVRAAQVVLAAPVPNDGAQEQKKAEEA